MNFSLFPPTTLVSATVEINHFVSLRSHPSVFDWKKLFESLFFHRQILCSGLLCPPASSCLPNHQGNLRCVCPADWANATNCERGALFRMQSIRNFYESQIGKVQIDKTNSFQWDFVFTLRSKFSHGFRLSLCGDFSLFKGLFCSPIQWMISCLAVS